jgi:hypothetical protein
MSIEKTEHINYETFKQTLPILPVPKNKLIVKPLNPSETFYEASQLLIMISPQRAIDSTIWLFIGSILYRISNGSIDGLDAWIAFSSSTSYDSEPKKDVCSRYWSSMKPSHESSIHTLVQYVREDANDTYQKHKYAISQRKMSQLIKDKLQRLKPCHFGEVLYLLCKYEYLYDDENGWYQWKEDTWNSCSKECRTLRNSISLIKEMMMTEYKHMYQNDISPLQNIIRDIEDKEEISSEDKLIMEEHHRKITELEEKRTYLLTLCDKLDELAYKNKIIKECTDLFYDTDGIITRYVTSNEIINKREENKIIIESPIESFVRYLVMEDKEYVDDIIYLTPDELLSKFNEFTTKNNSTIKFHPISLIKEIKKLKDNNIKYNGITTGVRFCNNKKDIHKTQFNKIELKNNYRIDY